MDEAAPPWSEVTSLRVHAARVKAEGTDRALTPVGPWNLHTRASSVYGVLCMACNTGLLALDVPAREATLTTRTDDGLEVR